jgi:Leucine-rich repeat (LRR) protein
VPLQELDISGTRVTDLGPLAHVPLTILRADDTAIADLTPLRRAQITELSLARTSITSLEPLLDSPITVLNVAGCQDLIDIKPLAGLHALQKLFVPARVPSEEAKALLPSVRFIE